VDGLFALPGEFLEDGSAGGVGESAEHGIGIGRLHTKTITVWLWFVKRNMIDFPIAALRGINSFDLRSRGRQDGRIRDEAGLNLT
jgi:hypothetical protein